MYVLALDTTTRAGSVALLEDERLLGLRLSDANRSHAVRLPGELTDLLSETGVPLTSVDLFAVASGPGAFTGLRIGIATMQGFAFTCGKPIVPVSALEALGHAILPRSPGAFVGAWMDAYRGEVFSALYRVGHGAELLDGLEELEPATVDDPQRTIERWTRYRSGSEPADAHRLYVTGGGTTVFQHLLDPSMIVDTPPLADVIGRIALARARRGQAVAPSAIQPFYVRRPDVEVERERRNRPATAS